MGSAHFLTAALGMMADHIEIFLAEIGRLARHTAAAQRTQGGGRPGVPSRRTTATCCGGSSSNAASTALTSHRWRLRSPTSRCGLRRSSPAWHCRYLGSNLKCGDALIGVADPNVVGASDNPLFTGQAVTEAMARAAALQREQAENPDRTPEEVKRSEELGGELHEATTGLRSAFDLWTADPLGLRVENTFVANGKGRQESVSARHVLEINAESVVERRESPEVAKVIAEARETADRYRFFHWPLEFPHVFHRERPGFDVVVGNPPWNEVTVEELAFYALREPGLRGLPDLADRRKRIAELDGQNPTWRGEFKALQKQLAIVRGFFSESGGYQLQGAGDTDLYQLFCERYSHLVRQDGRLGVVLPRTAFLAEGAKGFRQWLFGKTTVRVVDYLLNSGRWAFDMEPRYTVGLLAGQRRMPSRWVFFQGYWSLYEPQCVSGGYTSPRGKR